MVTIEVSALDRDILHSIVDEENILIRHHVMHKMFCNLSGQ